MQWQTQMAKGESRTSRVGGTQGSVLASETERTCHLLCIYTILTGHANLTNECRGVLFVSLYMCHLRTKF